MINNITMYKEKLDWYMLEETGVDTGVFIGHVLLTGFSHDVDGDGRDDPIMNIQSWNNVNENITGDTSGGGPWDGRIKANPGNTITVKFSEKYSGTTNFHEANATVEFWVAELGLQSAVIASNQPVTVTVVDQDMNLGFFNRDQLYVDVYSDSDAGGFRLLLTETEILDDDGTSFIIQNSGIFEGQFSSVSVGGTTGSLAEIFAKPGDTITVEYNECTLPQPFSLGDCISLAATAKMSGIKTSTPTPTPTPEPTVDSTVLTLDPIPSKLKVGDNIRFSGTLKTTDGSIVKGANITIKSTKLGVLFTIQTDNNGKFATNFKVPIGWSGLSHELFVIYDDSCDYSVFACSDYNHKTGKYDNYNSKSQLHSLTISSTPTLTPEPTPEPTTTSASFKKYTDDDKRFTIEYPDDWVLADSHPDGIVAIDDQYDWRTDFQVFLNEDDSLDNRSDSKVLRAIETNQWELCDEYTFGADGRKCSDFKVVDSYTTETNDGKKIYFIKMTFTLEWEDYLPGQENSMIKTLGLIYDGDTSWEMAVESFEGVFDNHYGNIIYMMKSFSLEPTSTTPTPTPTKSATAVPGWIKNNAEWWADGVIDDSSFLQGIQYLINEKIIVIPPTVTSGSSGSQEVPGWIKNNAEWWADGVIDDNTFVSGIQYLVKVGIIQVG
jgi:hypothetical protein